VAGFEAPAAEQVERGGSLREHGRWAQRQVADVLEDPDSLRAGEDRSEQRQRLEVRRLVGVVLNAEPVVAEPVREPSRLENPVGVAGVRDQEVPEVQAMAVVRHRAQPCSEARV
jgi:hypothetical protein